MKITIRCKTIGGKIWWHYQLTHQRFGRCGNGYAHTQPEALELAQAKARIKAAVLDEESYVT